MPRAIALFASARRHGNTGAFMDRIAGELGIEVVDLGALCIAPYDYAHSHRDDDFEPLMRRVLACDHIIFASPVYWYAVSSPMKIFLDRVTDFLDLPELLEDGRRLRGKTGYVVCTSIYDAAPGPFVDAFRDTFEYLGMRFGGIAHVNCADGYQPAQHDAAAVAFAYLLKDRMPG
ncbi:MAG: NAD(P)H-dependent oxidoreductase [Gammaproteobacteria bacterium]|nr:NAD(P)H-dependent oxidoreductase [Gammaproteobacteria bacterium]